MFEVDRGRAVSFAWVGTDDAYTILSPSYRCEAAETKGESSSSSGHGNRASAAGPRDAPGGSGSYFFTRSPARYQKMPHHLSLRLAPPCPLLSFISGKVSLPKRSTMGLFARLAAEKDAPELCIGPLIPNKLFFKSITPTAAATLEDVGLGAGPSYRERERERERACDITVDTSAIRGSVVVNATDIASSYYPQVTASPSH